ncbi:hypothetical protein [Cerasicoccus maritimus]|uniref:hypothetical protein n=1 Tax=Cerasicoccus maritimus TaxID=490089 RepID=UPI0028528116|nr:hypothetical protein [Cerasicoccus maritimus]
MPIQISYLADHPEHIAPVANWFSDEWGRLWTPDSFSGWWDVSCERANYSTLPLAYVAHRQGELVGAGSLDRQPFCPELQRFDAPWVTGLFATDNERAEDVKALLLRKLLETAKHFGYHRIYTFFPVLHANYNYEGRGWSKIETVVLAGRELYIMSMHID